MAFLQQWQTIDAAKVQSRLMVHVRPGLQIFSAATSKVKSFCFGQTAWPQAYAMEHLTLVFRQEQR